MRPELDAKSDHVFKQLFGSEANRPLLIDLLNAVLTPPPGKLIREVTLQNPFSAKEFAEDKVSIFDVRARDQVGRLYNVEMWCYFLKHSESLDSEHLPATLDTPVIHQAMRVLIMLSQDEIERHRYLSRRRAEREAITQANAAKHALREGREEGLEKGREEGLEKGLEKGELIGQIHLLQRLLRQTLTPKEDLLRLSSDELTRLASELTHKLLPNDNGSGKQPAE